MFPVRASRAASALALAVVVLLTSVSPTVAAAGDITFELGVSSPTVVTVGRVVAFPVVVRNSSGRTLNHVSVTGAMELTSGAPASGFTPLLVTPTGSCDAQTLTCSFQQLPAGTATVEIVFYFRAPPTASALGDAYNFKVTAVVSEGANDNAKAANQDTFEGFIATQVVATSQDFVAGHAFTNDGSAGLTFSTGLATSLGNPHGTRVELKRNAEVTVQDVPAEGLAACRAVEPSCFGWGSKLDVGRDFPGFVAEQFPEGFVVTMRWDASQLPSGMTPKKLNVIHMLDDGTFEYVPRTLCPPNPTQAQMPCYLTLPYSPGKNLGIEAVMLWDQNGIGRGW